MEKNNIENPKSENILKVINKLKSVLHLAKDESNLEMGQYYTCGTTLCHGGWYVIASISSGDLRDEITSKHNYTEGVIQMARDLGMQKASDLHAWAHINPTIWGNISGMLMFNTRQAFKHPVKRPKGAKTLQDIVDHWTEVYERVMQLEKESEDKGKTNLYSMDATKEILSIPTSEGGVEDSTIKHTAIVHELTKKKLINNG